MPPFLLILGLGVLNALTPFSIDLYLPAFNEIARDLHTESQRLALSVSVYFVGFALGQIFYGPPLDRFGRKKPIYVGLCIYLLATLGCMTATSIEMLLLFRFISALGGSAASVGAMTMVRDFFPGAESARVFSMLMLVLSVSPLLAPSIGSLIVLKMGWRSLFGFLAALCVIDFIIVALLPRKYEPDPKVALSPAPILKKFREILSNPSFFTYTLAGSFSFAGLFVYVAGSPGIFMDTFHVSPQGFGAIFAVLTGGMIGGGQLNNLLAKNFALARIFRSALAVQTFACLIFLAMSWSASIGLGATLVLLFIILISAGITYPNAASLALAPFTSNLGSASALLGFLQLGIGAVMAAIIGLFAVKGTLPTAMAMALSTVLGCGVLFLARGNDAGRGPADRR